MKEWPILEVLNWTIPYFEEKGINDNPRLDAELLLAHTLNLKRIDLYLSFDRVLNDQERAIFKGLIKKRASHEPVAYILGKKEFMSFAFKVTPEVLIPRPETELLVEEVLRVIRNSKFEIRNSKLVEIGTGSGNIAVSLAELLPGCQIYATDSSPETLGVAQDNIRAFGLEDRISLLCGNLFEPLQDLGLNQEIDFIVSNPPYIAQEEWEDLPTEVRNFEPRIALDGGREGLEFYRRIIKEAPGYLKGGGFLALEMGMGQSEKIKDLYDTQNYLDPHIIKDYQRIDRVIIAQKK